jgi:hypothetical protein
MTRRALVQGAFALVPFTAAAAAPALSLFDGRSLSGWKHGGYGLWTIEDGAIAGGFDHQHPGPGYLFTGEEFGDFTLELDFGEGNIRPCLGQMRQ